MQNFLCNGFFCLIVLSRKLVQFPGRHNEKVRSFSSACQRITLLSMNWSKKVFKVACLLCVLNSFFFFWLFWWILFKSTEVSIPFLRPDKPGSTFFSYCSVLLLGHCYLEIFRNFNHSWNFAFMYVNKFASKIISSYLLKHHGLVHEIGWDRGQISIKLGTKHVIYQKLTTFL